MKTNAASRWCNDGYCGVGQDYGGQRLDFGIQFYHIYFMDMFQSVLLCAGEFVRRNVCGRE